MKDINLNKTCLKLLYLLDTLSEPNKKILVEYVKNCKSISELVTYVYGMFEAHAKGDIK